LELEVAKQRAFEIAGQARNDSKGATSKVAQQRAIWRQLKAAII